MTSGEFTWLEYLVGAVTVGASLLLIFRISTWIVTSWKWQILEHFALQQLQVSHS